MTECAKRFSGAVPPVGQPEIRSIHSVDRLSELIRCALRAVFERQRRGEATHVAAGWRRAFSYRTGELVIATPRTSEWRCSV